MNNKKSRKRKRIQIGEELIKTTDELNTKNFDLTELSKNFEKGKKIKKIINNFHNLEASFISLKNEQKSELTEKDFNSTSWLHYSYSIQEKKKKKKKYKKKNNSKKKINSKNSKEAKKDQNSNSEKSESSYEKLSRIFGIDSSLSKTPSKSLYLSQSIEKENPDIEKSLLTKELKTLSFLNEDEDDKYFNKKKNKKDKKENSLYLKQNNSYFPQNNNSYLQQNDSYLKDKNNSFVKDNNNSYLKENNNSFIKENKNSFIKENNNSYLKSNNSFVKENNSFIKENNNSYLKSNNSFVKENNNSLYIKNPYIKENCLYDKNLKAMSFFNEEDDDRQFGKKQPRLSFHLTMSKQDSEKILVQKRKDFFLDEKEKLSKSFSIQNNDLCSDFAFRDHFEMSGKKIYKEKKNFQKMQKIYKEKKKFEDFNIMQKIYKEKKKYEDFQKMQFGYYFPNSQKKSKNVKTSKTRNFQRQNQTENFNINLQNIYEQKKTTLFIKNIPNKYTKKMMMEEFDKNFKNSYNFFYLPIDFNNNCNMGFAFINFVDLKFIKPFYNKFFGKKWRRFNSLKICDIKYARIQGREKCVVHFNKSSLMKQKDSKIKPYLK